MHSFDGQTRCTNFASTLKPTKWVSGLVLIAILLMSGDLRAQPNSLRPSTVSAEWQDHQPDHRIAQSSHVHAEATREIQLPQPDVLTTPQHQTDRSAIELTDYQPSAMPAGRIIPTEKRGGRRAASSSDQLPWKDPNRILDLIMKISLNLVFVLCFAFGAILLAKKWMQPGGGSKNSARLESDSLGVLQTLRLDQKTSVRLVQWRSNRFLIACDQNGIQSVNALNDSFDQTLTELQAEDQLVTKLLASLENKNQ